MINCLRRSNRIRSMIFYCLRDYGKLGENTFNSKAYSKDDPYYTQVKTLTEK